jgi:hypothetical protein
MDVVANLNTSGEVGAVKETTTVDPAMGPDANDNGNKYEQLESKLLEMGERLQKQSAIIGKLTNEKKTQEPKAEAVLEAPEKTGEISKYQALEEKLDAFQQRIQKQEKAATLSALELSLVEAGASPQLAKEQADYFAFKLGDRITSEETEAGEVKRSIADTDGTQVPVSQWARAYIESDAGSYLRATKTGPSVKNQGTSAGQAQKVKLKSADYSRGYSEAQMKSPDDAAAFVATHSMIM